MDDLALPIIDVARLVAGEEDALAADEIDRACRNSGFFLISGHGIDPQLFADLDRLSRDFFARPAQEKNLVAMAEGGAAWRGWFPVGGELTSGVPDRKEGLYVGRDLPPDDPRVVAKTPLHGPNVFPAEPSQLGPTIEKWLGVLIPLAHAVMRGIAIGLGLAPDWFQQNLTQDPTVLFRVFHYPPGSTADWGVAEHTDYGLLTLLAQDDRGGLQVHAGEGWIDVPADPGVFVCNIGDMLDRLTDGRYRSTPHRVRNLSGTDRLSFPLFFDPSWDAVVPSLPLHGSPPAADERARWDGADVHAWEGTYGDYLTAKVSRVFPELFTASTGPSHEA